MGISRAVIKLLMREGKREKFDGDVLTAGKQDVFSTVRDLEKWAKEQDFFLSLQREVKPPGNKKRTSAFISDETLFKRLGFKNVWSMDCSGYEKCKIIHDLNLDVPADLLNKFDLIFDGGTSEHIFNLPKVLENYNKMLKAGGRIVHVLPASNFVDHGFYMFSPTLFYDYYSANKWEIVTSFFAKQPFSHDTKLWDVYEYRPGALEKLSYGGLSNGMYVVIFIARKTENSTFNASVQQGRYLSGSWNVSGEGDSRKNLLLRRLPSWMRKIIRPLYYKLISKLPLRFYLKFVGKY
jgi:SAM-dependent methyltransferase